MSDIKIDMSRNNTTTYRTVLNDETIKRLMYEEVCRQVGVDPESAHIGIRTALEKYGTKHEGLVIVTIHHDAEPQAVGE